MERIVCLDMIDMLPSLQPGGDDSVVFIEGFFVKRDSFSGFRKQRFVFFLSGSTAIEVAYMGTAS